eukprot:6197276-Pleurochrysis_carterae.AAC.1
MACGNRGGRDVRALTSASTSTFCHLLSHAHQFFSRARSEDEIKIEHELQPSDARSSSKEQQESQFFLSVGGVGRRK